MLRASCGFLLALACVAANSAAAQLPYVDPAFLDRSRPDFANRLPLCILPEGPTADIDQQVARDLASILLLEPDPVEVEQDIDMLGAQGIWPVIRIALSNDCLGVMGAQLYDRAQLPDWLTVTQPYFEAPYILISDGADSIADLPPHARIATPLYTPVDLALINLIDAGGRWAEMMRIPYDRPELARTLLERGAVDAAIVWRPHLDNPALVDGSFYTTVGSTAPLDTGSRGVGILLLGKDTALRTTLDEAIGALRADPEWPQGSMQ